MGKVEQTHHELTESPRKCGHCGTETTMLIVCSGDHRVDEEIEWIGPIFMVTTYDVLLCPSCNGANVYATIFDSEHFGGASGDDYLVNTQILYPNPRLANLDSLPKLVEKSYSIAFRLRRIEPIASVVFSRKSIEAICVDQGVDGANLRDKIDALADKGIIPPLLRDAAHSVRLIGNDGAHELDLDIDRGEAESLLALCEAIMAYVYEAPRLLREVEITVKKSRSKNHT